MFTCLLLASGFSSRFGSPKSLAQLENNVSVINFIQNNLITSEVSEIIIVLGKDKSLIKPHILSHPKIKSITNVHYELGQTSSLKAGLREIKPKTSAILLLPVDFPLIQTATFNTIMDEFNKSKKLVLIPTFQGRKGHPPIFDSSLIKDILGFDENRGFNIFLGRINHGCQEFEVNDSGVLNTFNTLSEFEKIQEIYNKNKRF